MSSCGCFRCGRNLYSYIHTLVPHHSDAENIFQEPVERCGQSSDQYQPGPDNNFPRLGITVEVQNHALSPTQRPRPRQFVDEPARVIKRSGVNDGRFLELAVGDLDNC